MAYPVAAGGILECQILGRLDLQRTINTFHYKNDTPVLDGSDVALAALDSFEVSVWDKLRAGLSQDLKEVVLSAQWIQPIRYRKEFKTPANVQGAVVSNACPSGVAVVVRRWGELANKQNQGRIYVPGIAFADVSESEVTDPWFTANENLFREAIEAGFSIPGVTILDPVIFNDFPAPHSNEVINSLVDRILRYQRRREVQVGI